jgi:hypothetical protein
MLMVSMFVARLGLTGATEPSGGAANNGEAPVLQYFELIPTTPDLSNAKMPSFKIGKLLLTIRSIRSVTIQADGKGVIVVLNDADRKKFAELTRKFQGGVLLCQVSQNPLVGGIGLISAPTENGVIEFSEARSSGNIAEYLRHRFWE